MLLRDVAVPPPSPRLSAPERCPNCGAEVAGRYCHACGQDLRDLPTLRGFLAGAVDDLFSVDGRVWRTLRRLLANPGALSADYLAGRRARYLPPLRLYLVVSVIYFGASALAESRYFMGMELDPVSELLPRLMVLFLPAAALLLYALFGWSRRLYVEHLVVALHIHAFAFLVLSAQAGLERLIESGAGPVVTGAAAGAYTLLSVWLLATLLRSLRTAYGESWVAVVLKGLLMIFTYLWVILLISAAAASFTSRG